MAHVRAQKALLLALLITLNLSITLPHTHAWTWYYKKIYAASIMPIQEIPTFEQIDTPHFTQLILSWNAIRPTKGYFRFWGMVRNSKTKKWSRHKMFEWGADIQRSYGESTKHTTKQVHVRLEIKQGTADGFKIITEPIDNAPTAFLKMLAVTICRPQIMRSEVGHIKRNTYASVQVEGVIRQSQMLLDHKDAPVLCSPTATSMLLNYVNKSNINSAHFANAVFDTGLAAYGSWPFNTAAAYDWSDGHFFFYVTRLRDFMHLYSYLCKQMPVVVSIRCNKPLTGAPKAYPGGHLLIVIGYDQKQRKIICHDPAEASHARTLKRYNLNEFLAAWENSLRLAYVAEPVIV